MEHPKATAGSRYQLLESIRDPYLKRAQTLAQLTIPHLIPPDGNNASTIYNDPYQSIGPMGTNTLSSKLLLALLPSNRPYFELRFGPDVEAELKEKGEEAEKLKNRLAVYERTVLQGFDDARIRPALFMTFKHLVVSGNCLLHVPNKDAARFFGLGAYVVSRDSTGKVWEIVLKERVSSDQLPEQIAKVAKAQGTASKDTAADTGDLNEVDLYTHVKLRRKMKKNGQPSKMWEWYEYQSAGDLTIPGTESTYPEADPRWFALRFTRIDGEDYGRGFVEDYAGDLDMLDTLSRNLGEGAAAMSMIKFLVNPAGLTKTSDLTSTPNLGFCPGREEDVKALTINKAVDFRIVLETIRDLRGDLRNAFLMNSSVQRDNDRVTAEEVRFVAQELEQTLGGVYSLFVEDLQRPLVIRIMNRQVKNGNLKALPPGTVKPTIITGLDALSRTNDSQRLKAGLADLGAILGPERLIARLEENEIIRRILTANSVDTTNLVKDEEKFKEEQAQAQQQALLAQLAPKAAEQVGQGVLNQQQPPQQGN